MGFNSEFKGLNVKYMKRFGSVYLAENYNKNLRLSFARPVWRGGGMAPVPLHLGSRRMQVTNLRYFHYVGYRRLGGCYSRWGRLRNEKNLFPFRESIHISSDY